MTTQELEMTVSHKAMYRLGVKHGQQNLKQEEKMDFTGRLNRHYYQLGFEVGQRQQASTDQTTDQTTDQLALA